MRPYNRFFLILSFLFIGTLGGEIGISKAQSQPELESISSYVSQDTQTTNKWESKASFYGPDFLRASDSIQQKIELKINARRLSMLGRQWWNVPTEREEIRLERARYSKYDSSNLFPFADQMFKETGHAYNHNSDIHSKQNLTVFGWHPSWQVEAYKTYNFNLITHLSFCSYRVNPITGGYSDFKAIEEFRSKNSDLIAAAKRDSCKVLLNVSNLGARSNELFFGEGSDFAQENLTDSLLTLLLETGADGIDLNFEGVPLRYKSEFITFIRDLSFNIREVNNKFTISMSVPFRDYEGVYDLKKLRPWVDIFIVSGFNAHITKAKLEMGSIAPLHEDKMPIKGTNMVYTPSTSLYNILQMNNQYDVSEIHLLHTEEYANQLTRKLERYITQANMDLDVLHYEKGDIAKLIEIISASTDLLSNPEIVTLLKQTNCEADIYRFFSPDTESNFFLFGMNWDTLFIQEEEFFGYSNLSLYGTRVDENKWDIQDALNYYISAIGEEYKTSLIMGLPYHGSVWMDKDPSDRGDEDFYGYISYAQIRRLMTERNQDSIPLANLIYDKSQHTMILQILDTVTKSVFIDSIKRGDDKYYIYRQDTIWPKTLIYFDNSTSLGKKFDFSLNQGIGGVGVWSLGYDHTYKSLWQTIENSFANRWVWNDDKQKIERYGLTKNNKVDFTIRYQIKRMSPLTLATLFLVAIFMLIAFVTSLLDWKVRNALFYSGASRIFYLAIFALMILSIASYLGLFRNIWGTYFIGLFLGAALAWVASILVSKNQAKLP